MDNRFWIGLALIASGMVCILAVLGITAFITYQDYQRAGVHVRIGDWVVPLLFLFGLAGIGMVAVGVRIGTRK